MKGLTIENFVHEIKHIVHVTRFCVLVLSVSVKGLSYTALLIKKYDFYEETVLYLNHSRRSSVGLIPYCFLKHVVK